jgi:hypothetical protein
VADPDPGITAIDRVFDLVDSVVDKADHVLNRAKRTEEQHRARHAKRAEIDTAPSVKVKTGGSNEVRRDGSPSSSSVSSPSTTVARRRFRVVEAIAAETGKTIFVVTNGDVRAECTTRELAEKILRALEAAP